MKMVLEASRRMDEMSILTKVITTENMVFDLCNELRDRDELRLNADEWKIVSLLDGSKTVRQIIDMSSYDDFTVYKILYSVKSYGLIEEIKVDIDKSKDLDDNNLKSIVNFFDEIMLSIMSSLKDELGGRAALLFEECKGKLGKASHSILKNYNTDNINDQNIEEILIFVKGDEGKDTDSEALIGAFSEYCLVILEKAKDILGARPLSSIIDGIKDVLSIVKKFQENSEDLNKINFEMNKIFNKIQEK